MSNYGEHGDDNVSLIHLLMLQKVILMAENVILMLRRKIFHTV